MKISKKNVTIYKKKQIPSDWEIGITIPVPKKGDLSQCDNYRGIALMSLAAKLYNKILEIPVIP